MKKSGIIHAELASRLARLRHTDLFVIADSGLPVPATVPVVDLGFRYGLPLFEDVLRAILEDVTVEAAWAASEIDAVNPDCAGLLSALLPGFTRFSHADLKKEVGRAVFIVRTGEARPYANVILKAGVPFG